MGVDCGLAGRKDVYFIRTVAKIPFNSGLLRIMYLSVFVCLSGDFSYYYRRSYKNRGGVEKIFNYFYFNFVHYHNLFWIEKTKHINYSASKSSIKSKPFKIHSQTLWRDFSYSGFFCRGKRNNSSLIKTAELCLLKKSFSIYFSPYFYSLIFKYLQHVTVH